MIKHIQNFTVLSFCKWNINKDKKIKQLKDKIHRTVTQSWK